MTVWYPEFSGARRAPWSSPERSRRQALGRGRPTRLWSPARRDGMTACVFLKGCPEYFDHGATETNKHYGYGLALCARGETEFQAIMTLLCPLCLCGQSPCRPAKRGSGGGRPFLHPGLRLRLALGYSITPRGAGLRFGY
jgi:hypothetical protein